MGADLGNGFFGRSSSTGGGRSFNLIHFLIDKNGGHHGGQTGKRKDQCRLAS
jgi:hypothetical protein